MWAADTAEPATWQRTVTDSTTESQGPGAVALYAYLSGSATGPGVVRADDVLGVRPSAGRARDQKAGQGIAGP